MSDHETKKDDGTADTTPAPTEAGKLDDASLEKVAGGMGPSVPRVDHASSLTSLSTPVCLSQT